MILEAYLMINCTLFIIGISGLFVSKQNIIVILISIESMLLAINSNFLIAATFFNDIYGQLFFSIIICLAGSEASIGLAISIIFYRTRGIPSIYLINTLKG